MSKHYFSGKAGDLVVIGFALPAYAKHTHLASAG